MNITSEVQKHPKEKYATETLLLTVGIEALHDERGASNVSSPMIAKVDTARMFVDTVYHYAETRAAAKIAPRGGAVGEWKYRREFEEKVCVIMQRALLRHICGHILQTRPHEWPRSKISTLIIKLNFTDPERPVWKLRKHSPIAGSAESRNC